MRFFKYTHNIHIRRDNALSDLPLSSHSRYALSISNANLPSLHRNPAPASHGQRHPTTNKRHTAQRRDRAHGLEALRIQHEQVDRAAEHGHACGQQRLGPDLLPAGESGFNGDEGDGMDELLLGRKGLSGNAFSYVFVIIFSNGSGFSSVF